MRLPAARAATVGALDQAVFSIGNLAFFFVLARESSTFVFETVAIGMLIYESVQLALRGTFAQPASMLLPALSSKDAAELGRGLLAWMLVVGIVVVLAVGAIEALVTGGDRRNILLAVNLLFLPIVTQEAVRSLCFTLRKPAVALLSDSVWTVIHLASTTVLLVAGEANEFALIASWGAGALVGALVGMARLGLWPRPSAVRRWLGACRQHVGKLTAENVLSATQTHATSWIVLAIVGPSGVGAIRGVRTLFGPANAAGAGARQAVLPLAREQIEHSSCDAWRSCRLVGGAIATLGVLTTVVILAVPDSWGVQLLGETFAPARELAMPYGVFVLATSLIVSSQLLLMASEQLALLVRSRFALAVATVGIVAVSAAVWGTRGAISGAAVAILVVMPIWARAVKSVLDAPIESAAFNRGIT